MCVNQKGNEHKMCGTQLSSVTEEGLKNPGSCLETQKERKQNPKEAEIMISKESVQQKTVVFR